MGIIDPMVIGNAAATGVLEFSAGTTLWFLTLGLLVSAAAAVALSGLHLGRLRRLALPRLHHAQVAAAAASRAR